MSQMTQAEYIGKLINDLEEAKTALENAKAQDAEAQREVTNRVNRVNTIKKKLAEAIESLDLDNR